MFTSWIRRKSLKQTAKGRYLKSSVAASPVMLLGIIGLLVAFGIVVVSHSLAAQRAVPDPISAPSGR
jgi:hypothetical protein